MGKINAPGCGRNWALTCVNFAQGREDAETLGAAIGHSAVLAQLLKNRGFHTPQEAAAFLGKETEALCRPEQMADMDKAVARLRTALDNHEKIAIYGDYDVDGVTSVSVLRLYLSGLGADVSYFIPSRCSDGYGLAENSIDHLAAEGVRLIVTVDTGITAHDETEYAKAQGLDIIITDHHECRSQIPMATAVVNPRRPDCSYPFKELAGVGVVFKLVCALECALHPEEPQIDCVRRLCFEYADLVSLGTIADVMPAVGENRLIVSLGLSQIERTKRPGLHALTEAANAPDGSGRSTRARKKKKITSGYVGYTLAPRLNAAGRISDASLAVELLLSEDPTQAAELAQKLCEINRIRQEEENRIAEQAGQKILSECDLAHDRVIVLSDDEWHQGIIGIVASRLSEKYGMPAILVSFEGSDPDVGKGSGRSVGKINLVDALNDSASLLLKYGGHALAAGMSIRREQLDAFKKRVNAYVREKYAQDDGAAALRAEMELFPSDATMELAQELYALEPYGVSNPTPLFLLRALRVDDIVSVGANKHTKLILSRDGMVFPALCFGTSADELDLLRGDAVDILFNLDINEFQNTKTLQLIVRDLALEESGRTCFASEESECARLLRGELCADDAKYIPTREEFAVVYRFLRDAARDGRELIGLRATGMQTGLSCVKLEIILRVFDETGLLSLEKVNGEILRIRLNRTECKVDLEHSTILKMLKDCGNTQ